MQFEENSRINASLKDSQELMFFSPSMKSFAKPVIDL